MVESSEAGGGVRRQREEGLCIAREIWGESPSSPMVVSTDSAGTEVTGSALTTGTMKQESTLYKHYDSFESMDGHVGGRRSCSPGFRPEPVSPRFQWKLPVP